MAPLRRQIQFSPPRPRRRDTRPVPTLDEIIQGSAELYRKNAYVSQETSEITVAVRRGRLIHFWDIPESRIEEHYPELCRILKQLCEVHNPLGLKMCYASLIHCKTIHPDTDPTWLQAKSRRYHVYKGVALALGWKDRTEYDPEFYEAVRQTWPNPCGVEYVGFQPN